MNKIFIPLFLFILSSTALAQVEETVGEVVVDLGAKCAEEVKRLEDESKQTEESEDCIALISQPVFNLAHDVGEIILPKSEETVSTCKSLMSLNGYNMEPIKVEVPGDHKPKRNIIVRFTTGLKTVPQNVNTKMTIVSKDGTKVLDNFKMKYDTRWQHMNPTKWRSAQDATNFLHESTWGYQVDVLVEGKDKKRTGITLFFDHPKFKGAMAQDEGGNLRKVNIVENRNFGDTSAYREGDTVYHVQNSHMNIVGGLKVTRDLWVKQYKDGGRLSYNVQAGAGVNIGMARAVEAKVASPEEGGYWKSNVAPVKVQGFTALAGHGIEYEKGKMAVALTHTFQYSKIKQDYLDGGYVKYALPHNALALTVSVNVFNQEKRNKRRAAKGK